jgi:nucleotide-binding universal stress UspA family protein
MGTTAGAASIDAPEVGAIPEKSDDEASGVAPLAIVAEQDPGQSVVVVGVDGSPASIHALRQAATVVKALGGRIVVVYARQIPLLAAEPASGEILGMSIEVAEDLEHSAEADALAVCSHAEVPATFVRCDGDPGRSIVEVAHEVGASCVVVGATIHGAISSLFLSSVAEYLLHHCDLSLVIVRPVTAEGAAGT